MMFNKGRIIVAGAMAAAGCLLAACSTSTSGTSTSTTAPVTPTASSSASAATSSGSNLDAALRATTNSTLGPIVVDGSGRTLYRFDKDSASPPASNCEGSCAQLWPPVLVGTQISLSGVNQALLGTIKRPDGTVQLTLHGWPLYRYAGDSTPGQANGEGIGGVWFAARPTGAKALRVGTAAGPSSTGSSNNGSSTNNGSTNSGSTGNGSTGNGSTGNGSTGGGGYGY
jgi:predicted lipoprotein with Yx(FWY)xxD motif